MAHIIGASMIVVAAAGVAIIAFLAVLRVRSLAPSFARLQRHPMFEPEWQAHQVQTIERIQTGVTRLQADFVDLSAAIATLAVAIKELGLVADGSSRPIDLVLRIGLPWLAGVLRPKRQTG